MKKLLDVLGYGFKLPFTPIVIPWFVLVVFICVAIPVYYELPDGNGEIPGWAEVVGLIGLGIGALGVLGSLARGAMK